MRFTKADFVFSTWSIAIASLYLASPALAAGDEVEYIPYTTDDGTVFLDNDRRPSLYTGSFGDCQGNSLIDITRFDASLYTDNMTVMIHLEGSTNLPSQKVMMLISVEAYGESRLNMMINPCTIDTPTLCPIQPGVPIIANGLIPIGTENLASVPNIAYSIPDFEGQAILKIFEYPSQEQIACYAAAMTNGNSFSHPYIVGPILGVFALAALISSVGVTVYGQVVPEARLHYAHSVSVFMVFSVFHHIFFSGALSVNWPSVLVAFWSNFAWSAGMIYTRGMQDSINNFNQNNFGNITKLGATPANTNVSNLGGSYDASQLAPRNVAARSAFNPVKEILRRSSTIEDKTTGFFWYGDAVRPGLPLPGNYSGFAGTLSSVSIPASNAFLTGLVWSLIMILIMGATILFMKGIVELSVARKWARPSGWNFFRSHWLIFMGVAVLRLLFIAFFMLTTLTLFQLAYGGSAGALAIAAIVFILLLVGLFGASGYALWYRLRSEKFQSSADQLHIISRKRGIGFERESTLEQEQSHHKIIHSFPWISLGFVDPQNRPHVHEDDDYIVKFGWLAARFRRSKWWFFSVWLFYELIRACFYGGAVTNSLAQIFGLLAWEILAFVAIVLMRPFESSRLNLVMVYVLGFSKVATVALSLAFDSRFALGRILTTAIGIIIIIIQGLLTICLLVAITLGAIASYMSVRRDRSDTDFKPQRWLGYRARYFAHIEQKATDQRVATPAPSPEGEELKEPHFAVTTVRRQPKIEDQEKNLHELTTVLSQSSIDQQSFASPYMSRPASIRSFASNAPFGARLSRATWSTKDLSNMDQERMPSGPRPRTSFESVRKATTRHRASSYRNPSSSRPLSLDSLDYEALAKRRSTVSAVTQMTNSQNPSPSRVMAHRTSRAAQTMSWPRSHDPQHNDGDSLADSPAGRRAEWSPEDILPHDPFR